MVVVASEPAAEPALPRFYAGRDVFITGATGFLGKVLVERLLATCPDVGRLFLLVRHKKDVFPEKRLLQLKKSQAFDVVREKCPQQLDKLCIVPGDMTQPNLGLGADSIALLQKVSVVFHSAATLKFDEPLRAAATHNVCSVLALLHVCDQLPVLQTLVHVSTAYSNAELAHVEERVYQPPASPRRVLAAIDALPDHLLARITPELISPKPNTYTFTKALAETAVQEHGAKNYSTAIFRPTIVISATRHPFPGWIENLNGPSGVVSAVCAGALRVFTGRRAARADLLPVDLAAHAMLAVAWHAAAHRTQGTRVYNCSSWERPTTWRQFETALYRCARAAPPAAALWYPGTFVVQSRFMYYILELVCQRVPLLVADYVTRLLAIKTQLSLAELSRRLRAMNSALTFFSLREWRFCGDNMRALRESLSPADRQLYPMDITRLDWDEHYRNFMMGTRRYLLRESDDNIPEARRRMEKLRVLHYATMVVLFIFLYRFLKLLVAVFTSSERVGSILAVLP